MTRFLYYWLTGTLLALVLAKHDLDGLRLLLVYTPCFVAIVGIYESTWARRNRCSAS
jgi:hypothetical protein